MPDALKRVLDEALDDEYKAMATYEAAIVALGPIPPFFFIVEAQRRRADSLLQLYETYDLDPRPNCWRGRMAVPSSVTEACALAAQVESANAAVYERLLDCVVQDDVRAVLHALHRESQEVHLPALQRCAALGDGRGDGEGDAATDSRREQRKGDAA